MSFFKKILSKIPFFGGNKESEDNKELSHKIPELVEDQQSFSLDNDSIAVQERVLIKKEDLENLE